MSFRLPLQRQYQEFTRLRHIAEVLVKNGLGFAVEQLGLSSFLPTLWKRQAASADRQMARLSIPERVRRTIEELGPTYIKLGQVLSSRGDLLPREYIVELSKLLDAAPPIPLDQVKARIEAELGAPMEKLFAHFEEEPIAAASIGQVHCATLPGGEKVVVKVQRPGIETIVEADLDFITRQARLLERYSSFLRDYNLVEIVEEFGQSLRQELDYTIEGRHAERFAYNFRHDERVIIPRVFWDLSTKRVITLERLEGLKLTQLEQLKQEGYDLSAIAEIGSEIYLKQIFEDGFFHADPHPANIIIVGERIGFVDFGMVGYITGTLREALSDLLIDFLDQDAAQITRDLVRMGAAARRDNLMPLERDIQRLLIQYYGVTFEEIRLSELIADIFTVAFRHRVRLPADLALLARTLIVLEGLGLRLDPNFVLVEALKPFARRILSEKLSLRRAGGDFIKTLRQTDRLMRDLPQRVDDLWSQLEEGRITFGIELHRLRDLIDKLDVVFNRLSFSIVVAALIIGLAVIIAGGPGVSTWKFFGLSVPIAQISFILAGLLGAWLLFSIIRAKGL